MLRIKEKIPLWKSSQLPRKLKLPSPVPGTVLTALWKPAPWILTPHLGPARPYPHLVVRLVPLGTGSTQALDQVWSPLAVLVEGCWVKRPCDVSGTGHVPGTFDITGRWSSSLTDVVFQWTMATDVFLKSPFRNDLGSLFCRIGI